jgi:hypothetical protein
MSASGAAVRSAALNLHTTKRIPAQADLDSLAPICIIAFTFLMVSKKIKKASLARSLRSLEHAEVAEKNLAICFMFLLCALCELCERSFFEDFGEVVLLWLWKNSNQH